MKVLYNYIEYELVPARKQGRAQEHQSKLSDHGQSFETRRIWSEKDKRCKNIRCKTVVDQDAEKWLGI